MSQAGKNIFLQSGTGTGTLTIAGLRSSAFKINAQPVEATSRDNNGWRALIGSAGVVSLSIKSTGVLTGGTASNPLVARALDQSLNPYTLVFDDGDRIVGSFQVTEFEPSGDFSAEQTFSVGLESSGSLTYTPA